jgi:predicted lipoprotein with Yx(FWY)xxD motif
MRRTALLFLAAAFVIAGCGGSTSTPAASSKPMLTTSKTTLGSVLVDGAGRTLYLFAKDTGPKSTCSGGCAADWPPFTATSKPKAGDVLTAGAISLVKRSDGSRQVAIDGHPLYRYAGDGSAGQLNGQGLDAFGAKWFVVAPSGKAVTRSAPSSSSGHGYGY